MDEVITRQEAINNLKQYIGQDLAQYAEQFNIHPFVDGKQNKGWKGLVLERLAGLTNNNDKAPNGKYWEAKSVAYRRERDGSFRPKETMAITMINPFELAETPFYKSHCWLKLRSLVFCSVEWHGKNATRSELLSVSSLDFLETDGVIREIEADYEFIRQRLIEDGFNNLTGKYGKWIQPRTKGPGHGSISRAFYARKNLVRLILEIEAPEDNKIASI